ncbi:hypothetical protein RHSIM_Rhsim01G0032500 [Rhododendron simsii]|uniref:Uncharacterized protein n=1 Tax=Rhododendron simsii TaxID=118357 RepID=A0A834HIX7_RHOSS|nr:hypothetical protein RHSIM_Rhsim01G0032500 [Rhododendron simsii]
MVIPETNYANFYVPEDCWELIFNRLEEDVLDLAAVSFGLQAVSLHHKSFEENDSSRELGLNLKRLKALDCWRLHSLTDSDLNAIVDCFPGLEEVTISGYVTDDGVEALASKLKELKKIVF